MKKFAQVASVWPQIYQKLKNPPPGVNLGGFPGQLPPMNKIVIDPNRLAENPQAIGYVSTEDVNQDGKLDTIHLSVPRLEEAMRQANLSIDDLKNLNGLDSAKLSNILSVFVEVIAHELGHVKDFKPDTDNPFPGGEAAAESAAHSAVQQISLGTINTLNRFDKQERLRMDKKTIKILTKLAEELDSLGAIEVADKVDGILFSFADDTTSFVGRLEPEIEGMDSATKTSVPMGSRYEGADVTQTDGVISDNRPKPDFAPVRMRASNVRFKEDVGVDPGPSGENVIKVQQGLLGLGYSIGKGVASPDGDWGPVSTQSWTKFHTDYFDALKGAGYTPEKIQEQIRFFESGQISHVLGLFDAYQKLTNEQGSKVFEMVKDLNPEQMEAWKKASPEAYRKLIQYLQLSRATKTQVENKSPVVPEVGSGAETYVSEASIEGQQKKTASVYSKLLRQEKDTPFGR